MKPLRTIFPIVCLVLVHSGIEASADQYWMPAPGTSSAARAEYAAPGSFHNYIGDEPMGLPASYQAEAVVERTSPSPASSGGCTNSAACGPAACGSAACGRGLLWDPWVTFEYMHSWRKERSLPALVTSSPPGSEGVLPDAAILFGNDEVGGHLVTAGRLSFGAWLDEDRILGAGGKFLATGQDSTVFGVQSDGSLGSPTFARPFFNTDPGNFGQNALKFAEPGVRSGDLEAKATNDLLVAEAYGSYLLYACRGRRLDFVAGYQFARIDDSLVISSHSTSINDGFPPGTRLNFEDVFAVKNTYNGGELGLLGEYDAGPITFSALGKLGIGNMHSVLTIAGSSSVDFPPHTPPPPTTQGGLLAQPTNMNGSPYTLDKFCLVPEADLKMIYHLTRRLDFSLGYSLIYWNNVALAGDQIDTSMNGFPTVNASQLLGGQLVGPANPAMNGIRETSYWVQGMTFGLTLKL